MKQLSPKDDTKMKRRHKPLTSLLSALLAYVFVLSTALFPRTAYAANVDVTAQFFGYPWPDGEADYCNNEDGGDADWDRNANGDCILVLHFKVSRVVATNTVGHVKLGSPLSLCPAWYIESARRRPVGGTWSSLTWSDIGSYTDDYGIAWPNSHWKLSQFTIGSATTELEVKLALPNGTSETTWLANCTIRVDVDVASDDVDVDTTTAGHTNVLQFGIYHY